MTDNTIVIQGYSTPQQKAHILVIGLDGDDNMSHTAYVEYTPTGEAMKLVYGDEDDFNYGMPKITYKGMDEDFATFEVEFTENTAVAWIVMCGDDYIDGWMPYDLIDAMVNQEWNQNQHFTASGFYDAFYMTIMDNEWSTNCVLMTWKDDQGRYHEVVPYYEACDRSAR